MSKRSHKAKIRAKKKASARRQKQIARNRVPEEIKKNRLSSFIKSINPKSVLKVMLAFFAYFAVELFAFLLLKPDDCMGLAFGAFWSLLLTAICVLLPKLGGRIFFGATYLFIMGWTLAQTGYNQTFGKLMWLTDMLFAGEGATFFGDVLFGYSLLWWLGGVFLIGLGIVTVIFIPSWQKRALTYVSSAVAVSVAIVGLLCLPQVLFARDNGVWGTRSEYAQSSSVKATYTTMYSAKSVYNISGIYQLTYRDLWQHQIYPLTPGYQAELNAAVTQVDAFFDKRNPHEDNAFTGIFEGKNVILVLMESIDDWMITPEDTPTIHRLMNEGINFTDFYTPFYGGARTINTEFCSNSGIYLPTNGRYVFDYVTNHFNQSMASQLVDNGYSAEEFHYNNPTFYSRGVFAPALGYNAYNPYCDYTDIKAEKLYDDNFLFTNEQLNNLFFREGKTFNFIITRSAHLSYVYNEVLSHYALGKYPEYRYQYAHEEEACARVKAKLVDDMFALMLQELEAKGQLENTVIVGITDHYTYGFKDVDKMLELSGVNSEFLLEKTPCFIWSADGPDMDVDKTLNTSDLLPTVLNLMGIQSPYQYLGQDAFDPNYPGYALFADGSWITNGSVWRPNYTKVWRIRSTAKQWTDGEVDEMCQLALDYGKISNLLLTTDYYKQVR